MKIKKFTLMTLALLVSAVAFAQKVDVSLNKSRVLDLNDISAKVLVAATSKTDPTPVEQSNSLRNKAPRKAEVVTPPSDLDAEYFVVTGEYYYSTSSGWSPTQNVERTVKVYWDGNDVYIQGVDYYASDAYIKGTFTDNNTVVFPIGQYLGNVGADVYFGACDDDNNKIDATATFDEETNTFTFVDAVATLNTALTGMYAYGENVVVAPAGDDVDIPVEPPTDLVAEDWTYSGTDYWDATEVTKSVKVGFYGDEVYIQGLCEYFPEAWVKGMRDGNEVLFEQGQYYGTYRSRYNFYFRGVSGGYYSDVTFTLNSEENKLTSEDGVLLYCIDDGGTNTGLWGYEENVVISKIEEKAATPSNPTITNIRYVTSGDVFEFNLPLVDTNNEGMVADKLAYQIYVEDEFGSPEIYTFTKDLYTKLEEDMTEIPATFTEEWDFYDGAFYFNSGTEELDKIGIKSIYHGGGETHESEITWYNIPHPILTTAPTGTITTNEFNATDGDGNSVTSNVKVCVDGDNLYISNIAGNNEWIKGTKTDTDTYTFAAGQDMGTYSSYRLFLLGSTAQTSAAVLGDVVVKVDNSAKVYKFQEGFAVNAGYIDKLYYLDYYMAGATISMEAVSGIDSVKATEESTANKGIFNLAGQRVNDNYKGIVIKNGKKVIVK